MDMELREPKTEQEFHLYYDLRWRILREPWTRARETAQDEYEKDAIHIMAMSGPRLVGVGRLHFNSPEEAQVRYMAVENGYTGQGIGSRILEELEMYARRGGAARIVLNSRDQAVPFYKRHHYTLDGKTTTLFDSVVHWRMSKEIPPAPLIDKTDK